VRHDRTHGRPGANRSGGRRAAAESGLPHAASALGKLLAEIDGAPFGAYRRIVGRHAAGEFGLVVDRVPPDPFAGGARIRLVVPRETAGLPAHLVRERVLRIGVEDFLSRAVVEALRGPMGWSGSAPPGTGRALVEPPGPAMVERSSCRITDDAIEVRLFVDLPALNRRVRGHRASDLLLGDLSRLATSTLLFPARRVEEAARYASVAADHAALSAELGRRGLVAFVADGSVLARAGGPDAGPRRDGREVAFEAPPALAVEIALPHAGRVRGMGIPEGVTLLVGGGFHGKSTLLDAIAAAVRPHPPGDGRERVASRPDTVAVRTEPGRSVRRADISAFLFDLPSGERAADFSTERASGSTSQAAAVSEALEAGAGVLLLDEDSSALNFMIRDGRMQRLVPRPGEPVIPFVDRAREIYDRLGVSTVIATGGSGDYIEAAHTVIRMNAWHAEDATARAAEVASATRSTRVREDFPPPARPAPREPHFELAPGRLRTGLRGPRGIRLGDETVDLSALSQISETGEVRALTLLLGEIVRRAAPGKTVAALLDEAEAWLDETGLDALDPPAAYDLARPRRHEIAGALGRWRALGIRRPS
jgi:predicted ABC-class ATPase